MTHSAKMDAKPNRKAFIALPCHSLRHMAIDWIGAVAHSPADFGGLAVRKTRRDRVARREVDQLSPPTVQETSRPTKSASDRSRTIVAEGPSISRLVLALRILDLQAHGASSSFHISQRGLGTMCIGRIEEHCYACKSGHKLTQEF